MRWAFIIPGLMILALLVVAAVAQFQSKPAPAANKAHSKQGSLLTDSSSKGKMKQPMPTVRWREQRDEEQRELDSGKRSKKHAFFTRIHPDAFLIRMERILGELVQGVGNCEQSAAGFEPVMKAIQKCVEGVNAVNRDFDGSSIETDEREEICAFIDAVIVARGIDIEALAASQKCSRHELTDRGGSGRTARSADMIIPRPPVRSPTRRAGSM
jgi:hypothetical protein